MTVLHAMPRVQRAYALRRSLTALVVLRPQMDVDLALVLTATLLMALAVVRVLAQVLAAVPGRFDSV